MKKHLLFSAVALAAASFTMNAAENVYYNVGDEVTIGINTYRVTGENLIPNNSFDEGLTGWTNAKGDITDANFEVVAEGGADGGAYLRALTGGGSGSDGALITGWKVEPGKTYLISGWFKMQGDWSRFQRASGATNGTDDNILGSKFTKGEPDWTQYCYTFKATEELPYVCGTFAWLSTGDNGSAFDCFQLSEVEFVSTTEVVFPVELGKEYTLKETHNNAYLSITDETLTVQEKDAAGFTQAFIFEKAYDGENLYIKGANGKYITKGGNPWDPSLVDEAPEANNALFNLVENEDGTYSIKVLSSAYFGINAGDAFAAGSNIYFDKSGAGDKCTFDVQLNLTFPVDLGVDYKFQEVQTGAYLSTKDNALTIQNADEEGFNQTFSFVLGHDSENLYLKGTDGQYVALKGGDNWTATTISEPDPSNNKALFNVVPGENGTYAIQVVANGTNVIGADNFAAGSTLYMNKGGNTTCWFKLTRADGQLSTTALTNAIAEAEKLLANTVEGEEPGQYPAAAREALTAAIETAKAAFEALTQDEVDAAVSALNTAIKTYNASSVPVKIEEAIYTFKQVVTGDFLYTGWHANSWESGNNEQTAMYLKEGQEGDYNVKFKVRETAADAAGAGYTISTEKDEYLYNKGGKLYWSETADSKALDAIFRFDKAGENYIITSMATGKYVGPVDNTKGWSWIHAGTNHTGNEDGHLFFLTKVGDLTGIDTVDATVDANAPVEYFNLQGVRVANPENGLYIRRQGNKVTKVLVK